MVEPLSDSELRNAARHRGYRLVKSRVKTPGKGDYGKYGLIDAKGVGIYGLESATAGKLTASAAEIEAFLREASTSTWAASRDISPDLRTRQRAIARAEKEGAIRPRKWSRTVVSEGGAGPRTRSSPPRGIDGKPAAPGQSRSKLLSNARRKLDRAPKPEPKPKPEPALRLRRARATDADAVADLVGLIDGDGDRTRIASMCEKRGADFLVADRSGVVGVVAWTVIPTLQRGLVGRISTIIVTRAARRMGIGRALLETAIVRMKQAGAVLVEVIGDIDKGQSFFSQCFFRQCGFDQTRYRFARAIAD